MSALLEEPPPTDAAWCGFLLLLAGGLYLWPGDLTYAVASMSNVNFNLCGSPRVRRR